MLFKRLAAHTGFVLVSSVASHPQPSLDGCGGEVVIDAQGHGRHVGGGAFSRPPPYIPRTSCDGLENSF